MDAQLFAINLMKCINIAQQLSEIMRVILKCSSRWFHKNIKTTDARFQDDCESIGGKY